MALDINKLENVKHGFDGKITAKCPACAGAGADNKGEHLVVFPGGKYGCVANEGDAEHRKRIYALAGDGERVAHVPVKITVDEFVPPEFMVLMDLGRFGRFSKGVRRGVAVAEAEATDRPGLTEIVPASDAPRLGRVLKGARLRRSMDGMGIEDVRHGIPQIPNTGKAFRP